LTTVVVVFVLVYLGMLLGGLPFLQLDRTGIALLGTIALLVSESITEVEAGRAVHRPTLILLFSFMVVAAQLRLGGFYDWATWKLGAQRISPAGLLAALIVLVGLLAAVFSNDVVCLSIAPVLVDVCQLRRLDPVPYLLGLACAANIGSAATLIGNPQNMLIGERLELVFSDYLREAAIPVMAGLAVTWLLIAWRWRGRWEAPAAGVAGSMADAASAGRSAHVLDRWQALKGLGVAAAMFGLFLLTDWPREMVALGGAGLLLLSRRLHSRRMLGLVDWQVLLLFVGLFIVNAAFGRTGLPERAVAELAAGGIDLRNPAILFGTTFLLSNLVSNVPAIMLLLPVATPRDGALLALSSTLAGNLLVVGGIANIIVMDAASRRGVAITWREHARLGVPVTLLSLSISAWMLLMDRMPLG